MECYIDGAPLFYKEYGEGIPILCLHGFTVDHRIMAGCLEPIFNTLKGYRRIYPDLPGMGKSLAPESLKNADDMLEVVKKFINSVIGDEKFLLVGESYGGYLSIGLALYLEQQIEGMFFLCPCIIADRKERELPRKKVFDYDSDFHELNKNNKNYKDFEETAVIASEETFERYTSEVLPGLQVADTLFTGKYQKEGYSFSFADKISNIVFHKPACFILGRQDDSVGYMDALKLIHNFSRATFIAADNAGHNLQIERSDLFTASFTDWLDRVQINKY